MVRISSKDLLSFSLSTAIFSIMIIITILMIVFVLITRFREPNLGVSNDSGCVSLFRLLEVSEGT